MNQILNNFYSTISKTQNPLLVVVSTGVCASSSVLLGWALLKNPYHNIVIDWRYIWFMGSLGSMLGAHWGMKQPLLKL